MATNFPDDKRHRFRQMSRHYSVGDSAVFLPHTVAYLYSRTEVVLFINELFSPHIFYVYSSLVPNMNKTKLWREKSRGLFSRKLIWSLKIIQSFSCCVRLCIFPGNTVKRICCVLQIRGQREDLDCRRDVKWWSWGYLQAGDRGGGGGRQGVTNYSQ